MRGGRPSRVLGRIVIDQVRPCTRSGLYPAKAALGVPVTVSADIFRDGHDILSAQVRWRPVGASRWMAVPMAPVGNDRWVGEMVPVVLGRHELVVEAWTDRRATLERDMAAKHGAGLDVSLEQAELAGLSDEPVDLTAAPPVELWVDRQRALSGAWYEVFPRSEGGLLGTRDRLAAVAAMGFDVVYLPPIHPIGTTARKGRNNSLIATPDDPGSPWAIGACAGGHTAVEPTLGTIDDFDALVAAAGELNLEIALDFALQCSPDHPWVSEHPEWFHHRPDGSIRYAENPPKRYEDIYPLNFWPDVPGARVALWHACADILRYWIGHGVNIFRVDNPHTKPMAFWEWLIPEIHAAHPDVIFLAEAFTRPKVMAKLAEVGFSQSYTYFTWRTTKTELRTYAEEVCSGPTAEYMRPNFWPSTPDILAGPLRDGSMSAFALRYVLAATLVPSYGIYSGYELGENVPASDANEEYFDSEKYRVKRRRWDQADSLVPFITLVNDIRRRHPAFVRLDGITFHGSGSESILVWSRRSADGTDVLLMVVNLDPHGVHEDVLNLDLDALGLPHDRPYRVTDELSGQVFMWQGANPYVRLDPVTGPAHILALGV